MPQPPRKDELKTKIMYPQAVSDKAGILFLDHVAVEVMKVLLGLKYENIPDIQKVCREAYSIAEVFVAEGENHGA